MKHPNDRLKLRNGVEIPCLGFGTYQLEDRDSCIAAVEAAYEAGYRHIDTAAYYHNEEYVGEAIKAFKGDRSELFVTSKVWTDNMGYDKTMASFEASMKRLDLEYLDLFMIHWPATPKVSDKWEEINLDTWRALTEIYKDGRVRAIGMSNFLPHHLKALMETEVKPMVDQVEFRPGLYWPELLAYAKENGIVLEGWRPLLKGVLFDVPVVADMAKKYGKTPAQICIRFNIDHGVLPLPRSQNPQRIKENADVFDFELSPEDLKLLEDIPEFAKATHHPDDSDF